MVTERRVKEAFTRVKEDVEGIKNELAFMVRRVAKIEEHLQRIVMQTSNEKREVRVINNYIPPLKKKTKKKNLTWMQHLNKVRKKNPNKTLKQAMKIASKSWNNSKKK